MLLNTPVWNKIAQKLLPVIASQIGRNKREQAISLTFERIAWWFEALVALPERRHLHVHATAARACFELTMDLNQLVREAVAWKAFWDFDTVKRIDLLRAIGQPLTPKREAAYSAEREAICIRQHWTTKNGKSRTSIDAWWGGSARDRAALSKEPYETSYRRYWSPLSQYVHPGAAGFIDEEFLHLVIAMSHLLAKQCMGVAIDLIIQAFHLRESYPELVSLLKRVRKLERDAELQVAARLAELGK